MKRIVAIGLLALLALPLFGVPKRVAVSDFVVHSDNATYKYMGKGISEMIAVELQKARGVELVEREKRTDLLEEMEMSLSDMADPAAQIEVGKLLAAGYIVYGEIVDMDRRVLISLRMAEVETGQVVWAEKLTEKLSKYDYITGYFTKSILDYLSVEAVETTVAKVEAREEKQEEAVVAFSKAIDLYDKKETEEAKKELQRARRIDPESEVTEYYLNKLVSNSSKFKTITENYLPNQNPAYLGISDSGSWYSSFASSFLLGTEDQGGWGRIVVLEENPDVGVRETDYNYSLGYQLPILPSLGIGFFAFGFFTEDGMYEFAVPGFHDNVNIFSGIGGGAKITAGWAPLEVLSLGVGLSLYSNSTARTLVNPLGGLPGEDGVVTTKETRIVPAPTLGLLLQKPDSSLVYDIYGGYSFDRRMFIDPVNFPLEDGEETFVSLPLFVEHTLTAALNKRNTFLIIKQQNTISFDTGYYYGRLMPAVEHWFQKWISARLGIEGALMEIEGSLDWGIGGTAGVSFRVLKWGLDIDANVTVRARPSRIVERQKLYEIIPLVIVTKRKPYSSGAVD